MSKGDDQGSQSGEVIPLEGRRRDTTARREVIESDDFPTLQNVLLKYFPQNLPSGKQTADRQAEFLERYATYGEESAEFDGLVAELRQAVKRPRAAAPMVNEVLGIDLDAMEMRDELASLLDQITLKGEYSDEDSSEGAEKSERPPPEVLLDYWLLRRVSFPGGVMEGKSAPLWQVWLAGVFSALVGVAIMNVFEPSGWAGWFPRALIAAGIVVIAASSVAMYGLRTEVLDPDREKKRDEAKARARERREERKDSRKRLRNIIKP